MITGVVLSYTKPNNGAVYGNQVMLRNTAALSFSGSNKRIKTGVHMPGSSSRCILLGDCFPNSNSVICLMTDHDNSLFRSCGSSSIADDISVGDVLGVYEPMPSNRTLGEAIPIFDMWRAITVFSRSINHPEKPICMSTTTQQQVHFCQHNVSLAFSMTQVLTHEVKCIGNTCDRQGGPCVGCRGKSGVHKNVVLWHVIEIANQHQYAEHNGIARFKVRSYKLSELFADMDSLARMDYEQMRAHSNEIRNRVRDIVTHVNANGGWTVLGWHRRGVVTGQDGNLQLNSETEGHLVRVEPTRPSTALDTLSMRYVPA